MDKWKKFGSYERWKSENHSTLTQAYDEYIKKNYDWVQPDTFVSFDDFCMGTWQSLD